jgi:hypothetical protein
MVEVISVTEEKGANEVLSLYEYVIVHTLL